MTKGKKTKKSSKQNKGMLMKDRDDRRKAAGKIAELVDEFCLNHLDEDYRELCEDLTWAAYEEGLPLASGKPAGWASGIVHAIGFVNFLQDPDQIPHMTNLQLAEGFGISQQTMIAKSRIIRRELDMMQLDPDWCTPAMLDDNPLVWMLEVNGMIVDIRAAPRGAQEEAYRLGLIPYIPADRMEPERSSDSQAKIIQFPAGQNEAPTSESARKTMGDERTLFEETER